MGAEALMKMKATKKTKARRDPDYVAAWRACGTPLPGEDPTQNDLRERLDRALKSDWSIQALKAFAYVCRPKALWRYDNVTPAAWRWAVCLAELETSLDGVSFLERFNARAV
jgi:hypothetical protein